MEILYVLLGNVLAWVSMGISAAYLSFLDRRKQPICGCNHHYAMHRQDTGRCQEVIIDRIGRNQCTCPGYYGPEPRPEYIAREISS